jgi:zinc transport system ATP-binding protein
MEKELKIKLDNVSYAYEEKSVLNNISFNIYDRDIITVVGPNGGGKTTLLKLILGLLKPDSGILTINGKRPGYVPQFSHFDSKFPITVHDVVLSGRLSSGWGFYNKSDKKAAEKAIQDMRLESVRKSPFSALSGGQRQRVLIARALSGDPEILLLDEPTANVDASVGSYLSEILIELNRELTIMLVTHDMGFVHNLTGRVFCINRDFHEHPVECVEEGESFASHQKGMKLIRHDINLGKERRGGCFDD